MGSSNALGGGTGGAGAFGAGGCVTTPLGGGYPPYAQSPSGLDLVKQEPNWCVAGHRVDGPTIEYYDGVIVGHCERCSIRIELASVPGGVSLLQIQTLLGMVLGLDAQTSELEGFDLGLILELMSNLSAAVDEEEFAIEQARKLLELARTALQSKVQKSGVV